jgi:hypothetical protein
MTMTTAETTHTITVDVPLHDAFDMLIGAFDSSAISYWLRRAEYDEEDGDEDEPATAAAFEALGAAELAERIARTETAKPRLYGIPGEVFEVKWPEGFDPDTFDGSSIPWLTASERPWKARPLYFAPFMEGGSVTLYVDPDDNAEHVDHVVIDLAAIKRGMQAMLEKYPHHFADLVDGDGDMSTYDAFVQCCCFGEMIYTG